MHTAYVCKEHRVMAARKEPGGEEFGRRLRARREELGLSRRDVVESSGLSYPYVSQLETGYRLPSHKALAALAEALELAPSDLAASIPYGEALASSDLSIPRKPSGSSRRRKAWHDNPQYVTAASAAASPPDPSLVAQQIAELVGDLPKEQRLDALHLAQRRVMEHLVAEEIRDRRDP
jgi:transcriptional regulator with XRE-family HTH domain